MTLSVINIIMAVLVLIVIPVIMGSQICHMLDIKRTVPCCFTFGVIGQWAICQLIAVPLILLKQSFIVLVVLQSVIMITLCGLALTKKHLPMIKLRKHNLIELIGLISVMCMVGYIVIQAVRLQLTNADDSRFVVNAVDVVRTNRLLLTDVNTGKELVTWVGDLHKDVASPWPVYVAYISKVTGIHVATMFHTVLPPVLLVIMVAIYFMLGEEFFPEDRLNSYIFTAVAILVNVFGGYSEYSSGTFALTRLWQGKSVIAAIGIPILLLAVIWLYREVPKSESWRKKSRKQKENNIVENEEDVEGNSVITEDNGDKSHIKCYMRILLLVIALCLPSNMGFILTTIMLGCFGLVYGLSKKSFNIAVGMWLCCIPSLVYLLLSYGLKL